MKWIVLVNIWIFLGLIWDYSARLEQVEKRKVVAIQNAQEWRQKVAQLETMLEQCLKKGVWNLQGYYFECQATYIGVSDYTVYFLAKEEK